MVAGDATCDLLVVISSYYLLGNHKDLSGHLTGIGLIWYDCAFLAPSCSSSISIHASVLLASGTLVQWMLHEMFHHVQPCSVTMIR